MEKTKTCARCGRELPLTAFHKDGHGGYRPICKDCRSQNKKHDPIFRTIEHFLYYYDYERYQLQQAEADIIHSHKSNTPVKIENVGYVSDPTGKSAEELQKLDRQRKWIQVITDLITYYKEHNVEYWYYIYHRYFEGLSPNAVCFKLHIDSSAGSKWRKEIIHKGKELAAAAGLISYDELLK